MTLALTIYAATITTIALALLVRREYRIWRAGRNPRPGDITARVERSMRRT